MSDALIQESIAGSVGTEGAIQATDVTSAPAVAAPAAPAAPAEEAKPLSLDDALAKAIEAHSGDTKPQGKGLLPPTPSAAPAAPAVAEKAPALAPGQVVDPVTQRVLDPIKAPGSLTPALREKWDTVPREYQQFWAERERDMAIRIQETADARKVANEFKEVVQPYEAMLRQHNITATAHAKELFNLSHVLNTGTPQVKADVLARLIHQFQPDPQALAQYLNQRPQGQAPAAPTPAAQQPVNVQAEIDRVLKEREEQAKQAEGKAEWTKFANDPANEFVADLSPLIGKILDAELVEGNTYKELFDNAYKLACQQHPEVRAVLAQRAAAAPAAPAAPAVQRAAPPPRPNGSVKPSVSAPRSNRPAAGKLLSLDEAIAAAAAQHAG